MSGRIGDATRPPVDVQELRKISRILMDKSYGKSIWQRLNEQWQTQRSAPSGFRHCCKTKYD